MTKEMTITPEELADRLHDINQRKGPGLSFRASPERL